MLNIRRSRERGHAQRGWLDTYHTFSFADYYNPAHMGFSVLRVINEDRVAPGSGFPMHAHQDMEIITYVLEGALQHQDSMGNGSVIGPGEVQRMSAGTGLRHSEVNPSREEILHFLQIWILPDSMGVQPSYEQRRFLPEETEGRLRLVTSPDGRDGSLTIHQDALLYATRLDGTQRLFHEPPSGRSLYLQVARGAALLNGEHLEAGDGAAMKGEQSLTLAGDPDAELLLFDLP